jgi:hypothetical protein
MTEHDDDAATGIPERTERADSGAQVTESGRVATNRNVVQRDRTGHETSGLRDLRTLKPPSDDFDVVTPVRPQPRDVFEDEDATLSHDDDTGPTAIRRRPKRPDSATGSPMPMPLRSELRGPRIMPSDAGFTPPELRRRPRTEPMAAVAPEPDAAPGSEPDDATPPQRASRPRVTPDFDPPTPPRTLSRRFSDPSLGNRLLDPSSPDADAHDLRIAGPDLTSPEPAVRRSSRITPADAGFIPPESRRPGSDVLPLLDSLDPRRPSTARGHVEPRRRPTTPPPGETGPVDAAPSARPFGEPRTTPRVSPGPGAPSSAPGEPSLDDRPYSRPSSGRSAQPVADDRARAAAVTEPSLDDRPYARAYGARLPGGGGDDRPAQPGRITRRLAAVPDPDEPTRDGRGHAMLPPPGLGAPSLDEGRDARGPIGPSPLGPHGRSERTSRVPRPSSIVPRDRSMVSPPLDGVLRGVTILLVLGLGVAGLAQPGSVLRGGIAWLAFLGFAASGWGAIVVRIARVSDPDTGLRTALGAAGYLAVAGLLIALGVFTQPAALALIGVGFVGFAWRELTAPTAVWQRIRAALGFVADHPALAALVGALVALACIRLIGAVSAIDRNPWDDDLAYTPLVKRLLDTGDLIEPFSFRRLAAYGGQTALQALGAARGTLTGVHLIDQGLGLALALLGMLGHARDRRTQPVWLALIALVVLVMPEIAINTASYWTGVIGFLALYRLVIREQWALVGLVAGGLCTLRQNFLATAALFIGCVLIVRWIAAVRTMPAREAWQQERRAWAMTAGIALAVLVPWWIAAYVSSDTFLFPVLGGTWNHGLSLTPAVTTWPQEVAFLATACLDTAPIVVLPILALVLAFVVDQRPGRPLAALAIASALGFALLVHGFLGTDAFHLWRYAFGFTTPLAIALVLELGAGEDGKVELPALGRWIVLAALVLQILAGRGALVKQAIGLLDGIREAAALDRHGDPDARFEQRRYRAMQAAVPAGARLVVMVDDPAMLDFHRNPIANLDTPGFASPGSQLPAFAGAEPLRAYLIAQGYRYAAFVRSERSRYFFRRPFWVHRMFTDAELFQIMSAYTIDAIDSFAELATTTKIVRDDDGLVVLDLAAPLREARRRDVHGDEPARRAAWVRELADREGLHTAWSLTTRGDLRFEDGFGGLRLDGAAGDAGSAGAAALPAPEDVGAAPPAPGDASPAPPGPASLAMSRRGHLRVRAEPGRDMRLALRAAIALDIAHTHPRLDVSIDGELLGSVVADAAGRYALTTTVRRDRLGPGWHDIYLVFSSIAEPDKEIRDPRVAWLESVEWTPP